MLVMDFTVLIAEIPFAPPFIAAMAAGSITVIFGVIFAITGSVVTLEIALEYFSTSSRLVPTSEPMAWLVIWGQEKLHSIISAPACSDIFPSSSHSSSVLPITLDTTTLSG